MRKKIAAHSVARFYFSWWDGFWLLRLCFRCILLPVTAPCGIWK